VDDGPAVVGVWICGRATGDAGEAGVRVVCVESAVVESGAWRVAGNSIVVVPRSVLHIIICVYVIIIITQVIIIITCVSIIIIICAPSVIIIIISIGIDMEAPVSVCVEDV